MYYRLSHDVVTCSSKIKNFFYLVRGRLEQNSNLFNK